MNKTYPLDITEEINKIASALKQRYDNSKENLRNISRFSGLTVNSIKAVLNGKTANIASYSLVAKALGTTLIDIIVASCHTDKTNCSVTPLPTVNAS